MHDRQLDGAQAGTHMSHPQALDKMARLRVRQLDEWELLGPLVTPHTKTVAPYQCPEIPFIFRYDDHIVT